MAPDLDQLRKQAKELLRACRSGDTAALTRLRASHPAVTEPVQLADTQLVMAREHGFPSWPRLRAHVQRISTHGPDLRHPFRPEPDYHADRAYGLLSSAHDGTPTAVAAFTHRDQPLTRAGARTVVAAEHGFPSWPAFTRHLAQLRADGGPFSTAYQLIEAQDVAGLDTHLDRFPDLVGYRGTNGNDLLGLASSTCDERLIRVVLEHGADPAAANVHGWTALHQAGYSSLPWMAKLLLERGAPPGAHARGDGGTPLVAALFWGHRDTADVLAEHGVLPPNLRVAAGLDRVDLIEQLVAPDGTLHPDAAAHRGFYRPHGGFPDWQPTDDPAEIRDEAVAWAARNGAVAAMQVLTGRGANPDTDVYSGTPLVWATQRGRLDAMRWLLDAGVDVNQRGRFGGPTHGNGITALHIAAEAGRRKAVQLLLAAGADPTLRDNVYGGDAASWAEHGGHPDIAAELRG